MNAISTIGLDIAKNSFAVYGFDAGGVTVLVNQLKRGQVLGFLPANYGGSHRFSTSFRFHPRRCRCE